MAKAMIDFAGLGQQHLRARGVQGAEGTEKISRHLMKVSVATQAQRYDRGGCDTGSFKAQTSLALE